MGTLPEKIVAPLVSIVIPAFNAEKYIKECIDSALGQSHRHCEIIVVNDGSTDSTASIISEFSQAVTIVSQQNKGRSVARNVGLAASAGEYILFLDSDDVLESNAVATLLRNSRDRRTILSYGRYSFIDAAGSHIRGRVHHKYVESGARDAKGLFVKNCIALPTALIETSFLREKGISFKQGLDHYEDWHLFLEILIHDGYISHTPTNVCKVRIHDNRTSNDVFAMALGARQVVRYIARSEKGINHSWRRSGVYTAFALASALVFTHKRARSFMYFRRVGCDVRFLPIADVIRYFILMFLLFIPVKLHRRSVRLIFGKGCELAIKGSEWRSFSK